MENEGQGERGGGGLGVGWELGKEPASQCARVCQNYPLANYPLAFSQSHSEGSAILGVLGVSLSGAEGAPKSSSADFKAPGRGTS